MFQKDQKSLTVRLSLLLVLVSGILAAMPVPSARAGMLVVTHPFDMGPGSLRQAIADAMPGDTITFDPSLAGGRITLLSQLLITKDLTIDGSDLNPRLTLSGGFETRIMEVDYPAHVTISGLILQQGSANDHGGAVYTTGEFTAIDIMFLENQAWDGGAIWGGGITVINSTFAGNLAAGDGGAINGVMLDIQNTTFYGNSAEDDGGAISVWGDGTATIVNSTVFQNRAGNRGGGIFMTGYPRVSILNSTFAENAAVTGDEFALGQTSRVTFANTVFVCNASGEACYVPAGNLILNTNSVLGLGTIQDYGLAALAYHGGYNETMALDANSPLIDAGDDTTCGNAPVNHLDQRGAARPQGSHCDIGAYEYNSSSPATPSYVPPLKTSTPYHTRTPSGTPTQTPTRTPTPIQTTTPTSTPTGTPTVYTTPSSSCDIDHGVLTIYGNIMSLRITNQTGIPLGVQDVFLQWDHDRGHSDGNDKTVRLQQASLNTVPFWSGDAPGPSFTIDPANLSIPTGESTIRFVFHQSYDRSDGSEEFLLSWRPNICHNYPIHVSEAIFATPTATPTADNDINVSIGGSQVGSHSLLDGQARRVSYPGVNNGPVKITSTFMRSILGSEAMIYKVNGLNTSFGEIMGVPSHQLDTTYWLPWYNNVDLDTQLRIANVSSSSAIVRVFIGGMEMTGSPFLLVAGASTRKSFAGVNSGPVRIVSAQNIVVSERVIYKAAGGLNTSFSEMMALPNSQLNTTYWLPWYNNVDLDTQLRIANVSSSPATVTLTIGGVPQPSFNLAAGASTRVSYPGVNAGPVKIESTQNLVVAERVIYRVNGKSTSFSEMMALPNSQQDTTFWLPWYNNVDLDTQLRIANVGSSPATVTVTIGGVPQPSFNLAAGESTRLSFPSINSGPVKIVSNVPIVAAERVLYKVNGMPASFSEMMALPDHLLDSTFWFPWYNNVDLATQLRFGVP